MKHSVTGVLKRILYIAAGIAPLVITILTFAATQGNYRKFKDNYNSFERDVDAVFEYVHGLNGKTTPERLSYIRDIRAEAYRKLDDIESALDYFENLEPPESMTADYTEVRAAVPDMRDLISKLRAVFDSTLADDFKKSCTVAGEAAGKQESTNGFQYKLMIFKGKLDGRHREDGFTWN